MKIHLICVGKCKEKYLQVGCNEYSKRLQKYVKLNITEIPETKAPADPITSIQRESILALEGQKIEKALSKNTYCIALDITGTSVSSLQFAKKLDQLATYGQSHITFLIGGSYGLNTLNLKQADWQLSFSAMTFPHQMMRLILLEQIYRALKINRGEIYHK